MNTLSAQATSLVAPKPPRFKPTFGPCLLANHPVNEYGLARREWSIARSRPHRGRRQDRGVGGHRPEDGSPLDGPQAVFYLHSHPRTNDRADPGAAARPRVHGTYSGGQWDEIDTEDRVWTVRAQRMKAIREHRVPLCGRAAEILNAARTLGDGHPLVFPTARGKVLTDMALSRVFTDLKIGAVPHGFRSSFRDWAAEKTNHPREFVEAALAQVVPDRVEAAYARSDLFERRRHLMNDWAAYLAKSADHRITLGAAPLPSVIRDSGLRSQSILPDPSHRRAAGNPDEAPLIVHRTDTARSFQRSRS